MTIAVDLGRKATKQTNKQIKHINSCSECIMFLLPLFSALTGLAGEDMTSFKNPLSIRLQPIYSIYLIYVFKT